jgi:hypothetical protein
MTAIPTFTSHNQASCCNCGGDFGDGYWFERHGLFLQVCEKCGSKTYYDLSPTTETHTTENETCIRQS